MQLRCYIFLFSNLWTEYLKNINLMKLMCVLNIYDTRNAVGNGCKNNSYIIVMNINHVLIYKWVSLLRLLEDEIRRYCMDKGSELNKNWKKLQRHTSLTTIETLLRLLLLYSVTQLLVFSVIKYSIKRYAFPCFGVFLI